MNLYKKKSLNTNNTNEEIEQFLELKYKQSGIRKYQIDAYNCLNKDFLENDNRIAGVLVLPTGAGKTRVAVSWAIDKAINDGYKILWIAHRHMLLEQAYNTFKKFSGLCNIKDILNIKIVSGKYNHSKIKDINFKIDDIVVISIGSMNNLLKNKFQTVSKLLVIVDEAHHSIAPTYEHWIGLTDYNNKNGWFRQQLEKNNFDKLKILGLTATPINTSEKKEEKLKAIYDDREALFKINTADLMQKGILSQPILNSISTNNIINIDANIIDGSTEKQKEESINQILAKDVKRNHYIVDTYKKYYKDGKTLIFAINVEHAEILKAIFNENNINSEIISSHKHYKANNDKVIEIFRQNDSRLDVLININILTEGSDIPNIQNLFITRIIGSETLYTQMIGRALRGVQSGGTKTANIVTFEDNIRNFDILSLKDLFVENGWSESDIKEKSFKDIQIWDDTKYTISEISDILEKKYDEFDENNEYLYSWRYNLIDIEMMKDERISSKIDKNKQHPYILGIRDTKKNTKRWAFTKEQGQFNFNNNIKSDINNLDNDSFYFITTIQKILMPRQNQIKYWQEVYKTFINNNIFAEIEMLPSYGMPMGEYQLVENDEIVNTIPVFKFQLNSYERFLEAYFNNMVSSLNIESIKEKYFLETNNFIPINDRILENLLSCINKSNERPEFIKYDFEKMNKANDIIDNIAIQLADSKTFNLNIEYDNNKVLHSIYSRKNFKKEVEARADILLGYEKEAGTIEEIPIEKLNLKKYNYVDLDEFNETHNLNKIYKSASKIICKNLNITYLKNSPSKAVWTKKAYKSYFGIARGIDMYTKHINKDKSKIEINSILCSKDIPSYVIEYVLYHEMLHFELKIGHTPEFKRYEAMHPKYEEAEQILSDIGDWLDYYWKDEEKIEKNTNLEEIKYQNWSYFNKDKTYTLDEVKKILQDENFILPKLEELSELVKDGGKFHNKSKDEKPLYFISNDLKNGYTQFRSKQNNVKDKKITLIVKKKKV